MIKYSQMSLLFLAHNQAKNIRIRMHNMLLLASQSKRRISDLFQIYSLVLKKNWNNIYELAKNKIPHVFR